MCPWARNCAMLMAGFVMTDVLCCGFEKEQCSYSKNRAPDIPIGHFNFFQLSNNAIVLASASTAFLATNIGQHIGDLSDGKKIFYVEPDNLNIRDGKFRIVDKGGKETIINFEKP